MRYLSEFSIGSREISLSAPTYFIADIASNHDGDLDRAKMLIRLAGEVGANAVKFQHFLAEKIVSDQGFRSMGGQLGHQARWGKPVFDIYRQCECPRDWTETLAATAKDVGIDFLTTPYDLGAVALVAPYIPAYKVGSGDITWLNLIRQVALQGKPVILATGAATLEDVEQAVEAVLAVNPALALLQCNTNYTGALENFRHINLRVLQSYATRYPGMILGLSDHTPGHATVLGAITLGARIVEKHFTDDNARTGPDHAFSMNPTTWADMVARSRELEMALGTGIKRIEANEVETVILQRRCLRLTRDMPAGAILSEGDLEALRPAPVDALVPWRMMDVLGSRLRIAKIAGDALRAEDLEQAPC